MEFIATIWMHDTMRVFLSNIMIDLVKFELLQSHNEWAITMACLQMLWLLHCLMTIRHVGDDVTEWTPYQIRKICRLRMRWECWERFPRHRIQRKQLVSDPGVHHGTCVIHVPWCMSGSLTRGSRHSRRMRNSQFYVSGKRPMLIYLLGIISSVIYDYHCSITMVTHKLCYCIQCHNVEYV